MKIKEIEDIVRKLMAKTLKEMYLEGLRHNDFRDLLSNESHYLIIDKKFQKLIVENCPEELIKIEILLDDDIRKEYDWLLDSEEIGLI